MRVVSRRVSEISLSGGSVRSVRREVRLVMVDVQGAGATHDDGDDVDLSICRVAAEGIGERGVFSKDELRGVR
jgi:hypothetical protein